MVDTVLQLANANNMWSAQQAQKQMDFQREMSDTAHQREIADLKASGLNPVLSAKLGGASTPSGAMGDTDTSVTSAIVNAMSNMAQGMAFGYASGSAKSNLQGDGSLSDWLHVAADALPYRWRKSAHGLIDQISASFGEPYASSATSSKNFLQRAWDYMKNYPAPEKTTWQQTKEYFKSRFNNKSHKSGSF